MIFTRNIISVIDELNEMFILQAFQDLWMNERLLNVIEQFIGPEIGGHPVWNLRTKVQPMESHSLWLFYVYINIYIYIYLKQIK